MTLNWEEIREKEFPALKNMVYFMSASASPLSTSACEKGISYFKMIHEYGDLQWDFITGEIDETRNLVAEYINARPEEIAFLINTSSGMTTVAHLFETEKGEVLFPSMEFPASIHIFKRMHFPCKKIKDVAHKYLISDFESSLSSNTRFLIHSYVQSLSGFRQDLREIGNFCKENALISIINATQAFGAFPIDVKDDNIDILVSNGLKWMACGYGIGILYINETIIEKRELPFTGWLSVDDPFTMDNENLNVIQETRSIDALGGCPNIAALFSLKGGLEMIKNKIGNGNMKDGVKVIKERIIHLTSRFIKLIQELGLKIITPLDLECRSGIITIEHENAEAIHDYLTRNDVHVSLKNYPKNQSHTLLRFAINYYNNQEDINQAINVLKKYFK